MKKLLALSVIFAMGAFQADAEEPSLRTSVLGCLELFPTDDGGRLFCFDAVAAALAETPSRGIDEVVSGQSAVEPAEIVMTPAEKAAYDQAVLELVDWNWKTIAGGYVAVQGRVTNISGGPLKNVQAVVIFLTASGETITTDTALITYNPILNGQTSPFKVLVRHNPAMKKANLEFKVLFGGSLAMRKKGGME